ncbi:MAG TPA: hypothetical protein ENK06_09345 [Gammaproteobacteria bacterium]|nr:hypothetical protein [Gammaproteobacteria bacterium]
MLFKTPGLAERQVINTWSKNMTINSISLLKAIYFLILVFLPMSFAYSSSENITLVYTGNLDGELEPCGCSEGGNKGGLKRRAQALDDLRKDDPDLYLISTGGLLISEVAQDKLKSQFILSGMEMLAYDAIGVQWKDLSYGEKFLKTHKLPFVLSNSRTDFLKQRTIQHKPTPITFFSWLDPTRNPQKKQTSSIALANPEHLEALLATAKADNKLTVLATTLPLKLAQRKLPLKNVDILLIKAKYERYGEPQQIGNMLVLQPGSRGMRIGKLKLKLNKGKLIHWEHNVIALPPEVADAPRMNAWYAAYNQAVKSDYEKRVALAKNFDREKSPFAGEAVCKNCHQAEYEKWSNSAHSEAFYSLQDVNKAFDPDCIQCHTVGFNKPGGFIEPTVTENLMHVQCENCHGPAKAHANSAGMTPVTNLGWSKQKICGQCHIPKHSPDFDIKAYWPQISHGK